MIVAWIDTGVGMTKQREKKYCKVGIQVLTTGDFMKKVLPATCALRDRWIVSIEQVYTPSTFYMKSAVAKHILLFCFVNPNPSGSYTYLGVCFASFLLFLPCAERVFSAVISFNPILFFFCFFCFFFGGGVPLYFLLPIRCSHHERFLDFS